MKPDALRASAACLMLLCPTALMAQRQMEHLERGAVAVKQEDGRVFVSWRLLGTDPEPIAFDVYRATDGAQPLKRNAAPLTTATCFQDAGVDFSRSNEWSVKPLIAVSERSLPSESARVLARPYLSIPLQTPEGYSPNDGSAGDLDGDGNYEIVVHQVGRGRDNSQRGTTSEPILEAYKLDGTLLWRIRLGKNIREGAHYTQFLVYDFDGDGRAEVVCKTADGTTDGTGKVIGDPLKDHRNSNGYVLDGPEFLTVFDGLTGQALATHDYLPARGRVTDWGDEYGNRVDRFLACVAYLDGRRPSFVMCRGYYTRAVLVAWDWRDGKLTRRWTFDSDDGTRGQRAYRGQGAHSLSVADVDADGRDEIIYGAATIDDDGRGLYSTELGHGDALHVSDIDPDRPGLEVFNIHERPKHPHGVSFREARTGQLLWSKPATDVGRGVAMDLDPRHRGYETWASGDNLRGLWNVKGELISDRKPRSCNFGVWWDGDLLRELLNGTTISKWNWQEETESRLLSADGCLSNNGSKSTPVLCADLLGDWREEVLWRSADNRELRLYTTTLPTDHRLPTLMHDPQYRLSVAWQNVAYNQPTQPGFYLGDGMPPPQRPRINTTRLDPRKPMP